MTIFTKQNKINRELSSFKTAGYVLHSLECKESIYELRSFFEKELKKRTNSEISLETYHHFVEDDKEQTRLHYELSQAFWKSKLHIEIFKKNNLFFKELAGLDLDVQVKPHFRLARANKPQDNIGFHRDIEYGVSAYETSCFFALTNIVSEGALQIAPQSHTLSNVKIKSINNDQVEKGSIKHQLGVPYKFQTLADESFRDSLISIPMKIGEVLCFNLALIHGQEINKSASTRWSFDARIKNTFIKSSARDEYYASLFQSPATKAGLNHYKNNPGTQK